MKKSRNFLIIMLISVFTLFAGCEKAQYNIGDIFEHTWTDARTENIDLIINEDGFLSFPIVSVKTQEEAITAEYSTCEISVISNVEEQNITDASAQIKVRGNGTARYDKKPYRIKFDQKQSMLGLNDNLKAKSWVLLAEYTDKSMLKNATAFYLAQQILGTNGYYVSDYKFVEVYINNFYQGIYLLAEQQQVNKKRVNITEPEKNYEGTDIGYLLEMDTYYIDEENYFEIEYDNLQFIGGETARLEDFEKHYVIKSDIYSEEQKQFANSYLQNVWDVVYDAVFNDHTNEAYLTINENNEIVEDSNIQSVFDAVGNIIDVNSLVDMFILHEICEDIDVGWSSFYMSFDFGARGNKKLTFQAPWDFDWAFGQGKYNLDGFYTCAKQNEYVIKNINPWLILFCNQNWFMDLVKERINDIKNEEVFEGAIQLVDTYSNVCSTLFERNYIKWKKCLTYADKEHTSQEYKNAKTQKEAADWLVEFLEARRDFLFSHFITDEQDEEVITIQE